MDDTRRVTKRFAYPADDDVVQRFFKAQDNQSASMRILIGAFAAQYPDQDVVAVLNSRVVRGWYMSEVFDADAIIAALDAVTPEPADGAGDNTGGTDSADDTDSAT